MLTRTLNKSPLPRKSNTAPSRLGYVGALDGLRALAVIAVLLYHADVLWLPGGFLGVEIFFVVSGYLITSLLLAEYRENNSIRLKQFWQRRARRLLPALFTLVIAVLVYAVIFLPDEVASLRGDVLAAFTYVTNWYLIVAQKSYFEVMGRPSLLRHLWSLAVEEQFYLVWPLLFAFVLTRFRPRAAVLLLMIGAAISALWMGAQFQPDTDPSRIYYGTDTRASGLLIGAALAFVGSQASARVKAKKGQNKLAKILKQNKSRRIQKRKRPRGRDWLLDGIGVLALVGLAGACLFWSEFDPFLYQGGMLLVAAATAFVIAAVVSETSPFFASVLSFGVLRRIGLRSYSLYLWHWPVFMLTRPQLDTTLEGMPLFVLRLALTFALAEISYRAIESPIRVGALGKLWNAWKESFRVRRWATSAVALLLAILLFSGTFVLGNAVIQAQPAQESDYAMMTAEEESASADENFIASESQEIPSELESSDIPSEFQDVPRELESSNMSSVWYLENQVSTESDEATEPRATITNEIQDDVENLSSQRPQQQAIASTGRDICDVQCEFRLQVAELKTGKFHAPRGMTLLKPAKSGASTNAAPIPKVVTPVRKTNAAASAKLTAAPKVAVPKPAPPRVVPAQVFAIGDSVMLGAAYSLRKIASDVEVDAKVGRQVSAALAILRARKASNLLAPIVIVHLGNNGTFSLRQFEDMMAILQDVPHVIFLNNKVPRKWQEPNNSAIADGVKKYPNARLIDWYATSYEHAEWFWKDGIHLRPEGAQVYANAIAWTIQQSAP